VGKGGGKRCRALPRRAREGICGVLPLKARKKKGDYKGAQPLYSICNGFCG